MPIALSIGGLGLSGTSAAPAPAPPPPAPPGSIAAMPPINIDGISPGSGQANLTWTLSLFLGDGSAIGSAVVSLTVYYSATAGDAQDKSGTRVVPDLSAGATSVNLTGVPSGLRYFAISANVTGLEGPCSNEFPLTVS